MKTYQKDWFHDHGIPVTWPEHFYTRSNRNVIRGLHFQVPPSAFDKLVYCVQGTAWDVVADLRIGSPTYGEFEVFHLNDESWRGIFIPKGLAHGFAALSDATVLDYATTAVHDPARDAGIRWDSLAIPWPIKDPIVSARDAALPAFTDYVSPFSYE